MLKLRKTWALGSEGLDSHASSTTCSCLTPAKWYNFAELFFFMCKVETTLEVSSEGRQYPGKPFKVKLLKMGTKVS